MSGWLFLGIATVMCLGVFLNGMRFAYVTANPWAGKRLFGMPVEGSEMSVAQVRRLGRLQMLLAPAIWLLFVAFCFGLLGPVDGIETIDLSGGRP